MLKLILTATAALLAALALAGPAGAAAPFTAGTGTGARIAADQENFGHVVWGIPSKNGQPAKVGYCRVPPGGNDCDVRKEFPFPSAPGQVAQGDPLDVTVHTPRQLEVMIVASCTACGDGTPEDHVFLWASTTKGAEWSAEALLGKTPSAGGLQPGGIWIQEPTATLFFSPQEGDSAGGYFLGEGHPIEGSLIPGYTQTPSVAKVPVGGGNTPQYVLASSDGTSIRYSVFNTGLDGTSISTRNNWSSSPKGFIEPSGNAEPQLNSGPTSMYLTYRRLVSGDNKILFRRFNSDPNIKTFGGAQELQGASAIDDSADLPDSTQDVSGRVHVVWTSQHDGGRLRYIVSDISGATFSAPVSVARGEGFGDPDVAAGPNGTGWATWSTGADSPIRVVRLEAISDAQIVQPPPATCPPPQTGTPPNCATPVTPPSTKPVTRTAKVSGATLTFGVQRACVKPGSKFKVTLTWKKSKKKGNLFVKVAKTDFLIGSKVVKTDKTAPFTQSLTATASAKAGSTMTVKARAHIKMKRGKSPKKSISSSIKVCA